MKKRLKTTRIKTACASVTSEIAGLALVERHAIEGAQLCGVLKVEGMPNKLLLPFEADLVANGFW
jgi:hypothetical protein